MNRSAGPLAFVAVLLAGCVDRGLEPLGPEAEAAAVSPRASSAVEPGSWVVDYRGNRPADLTARVEALGGRIEFEAQSVGFAVVRGLTDAAAQSLSVNGRVTVFADVTLSLDARPVTGDVEALAVSAASIANPAGGFLFPFQWNLRAISANTAWAAGALGSPDVTVAILDSGIDYDGYDMNGMVDLARSKSFVASDDAIVAAFFPGRHPIDDLNGHGSNVATQASSNATIFAGVNSRARLIGVKVIGYNGVGSLAGFLGGLVWAADNGADVANLSLGVPLGVNKSGSGGFVALTNRVFNYAHRKGMVVVVAAGNDAANMDDEGRIFRAYCEAPHVVCVSATGPTASTNPFSGPWSNVDAFASYSNYGVEAVTVSAPGGTLFGFISSVCARHLLVVSAAGAISFPCNAPPGFFVLAGYAGTSQAAPHVAGVVAQLVAKYGKGKPAQIKELLINSVDDLGAPGPDPQYGIGRVNIAKGVGL